MATLKFAETHNLVAFLSKPKESDGFEQIVDFLNAHPSNYALTVNPTIYTSCIKQFWSTAKVKTVNGEPQLQAIVDGKNVIVTETSIRRALHLKHAEGKRLFLSGHTLISNHDGSSSGRSGRKQGKGTEDADETIAEEAANVESVSTHSNDPLFSEITELKERVKQLEKKRGSRTHRLKRLRKVGRSAQVISSKDEGLGDQEDASKQGKKIVDIDDDAEVTLIDETQERNYDLVFDTGVLDDEEVFVGHGEVEKEVSVVDPVTTAEIKAAKPKVIFQEPSEFTTTTSPSQPSQLPQAKDKGKAKMIEPEKPLKMKEQIRLDKELALKLQAEEEEDRLAREKAQQVEEANMSWDNVQAMMEADRVNMFVDMDTEMTESSKKVRAKMAQESSSKRTSTELEQEVAKMQKIDDDQEEAEMKNIWRLLLMKRK
ncbi:hypothetical protein Tco_0910461 [Tanacetum coccineum]|uniref:Xylulose kinase-1 n=1 Tax=Tanacetum coccineum TaxID=301880 RepID=A0ABQ5CSX4_9ASTR